MRGHNTPDPSFSVCLSVCLAFLYSLVSSVRLTPELFGSWQFSFHPTAFWLLHLPARVTLMGPLGHYLCWLLCALDLEAEVTSSLSGRPLLSTGPGCISREGSRPSIVLQEYKESCLCWLILPQSFLLGPSSSLQQAAATLCAFLFLCLRL